MKTNALSVANYFIDLAMNEEGGEIHLLGLVKRVYIAHGFSLALRNKPLLNPRFDRVEAWKYGPVIPSVYHSFKQYRNAKITKPTEMLEWDEDQNAIFVIPNLEGEEDRKIVEMVWKRYHRYKDSELVSLTHGKGTPWELCYIPEKNVQIPDAITMAYYSDLVNKIIEAHGK